MVTSFLPEIKKQTNNLISKPQFKDILEKENITDTFFLEYQINELLTKKFINDEYSISEEVVLSEEEIENIINSTILYNTLKKLKKLGLIDVISNENDEEVYFLTEMGKQIGNNLELKY